eukprot:CAMPEP_0168520164 /NCGR_PEP_ID=MMETSP0405-20121227/7782_1 /TAXON_ID=498012 /ORGANISM="Trichosphaerium sp, Strain Am-I-7 wt" /LENGTH=36 /DNA_ID= /DNA_START= /DNA_END= /DNA_ORIENTATION=
MAVRYTEKATVMTVNGKQPFGPLKDGDNIEFKPVEA